MIYTGKNPNVKTVEEIICPKCGKKKKLFLGENNQNVYEMDNEGNKLYPSVCDCEEEEEREMIQRNVARKLGHANISTLLYNGGFTDKEIEIMKKAFIVDVHNKAAQDSLIKWVANFAVRSKENFLIVGPTGRGKTFLAIKISYTLINRNISVFYINVKKYTESLRASNDSEISKQIKRKAFDCSVLILDDLGAEKTTEFAQLELYELLDHRSQYKSTIITTNLNPNEIKQRYGERTYSRIIISTPIENILSLKGPPWPR